MANNISIGGQTYDLSTQSGRADARTNNPGLIVDANSVYDPSSGQQSNATSSGGGGGGGNATGGGSVAAPSSTVQASSSQLSAGINSLIGAIASGNKQAFDEAVRQFNVSSGLDRDKFNAAVDQFNQQMAVSAAGLTGTYQGQQTQQAALQAANIAAQVAGLTGYYTPPTTAGGGGGGAAAATAPGGFTQQQYQDARVKQLTDMGWTPQNAGATAASEWAQGIAQAGSEAGGVPPEIAAIIAAAPPAAATPAGVPAGSLMTQSMQNQIYNQQLGAINAAAALQANPFRQQQVIGQLGRVLSGQGVAGFSAPTTVAGVGTAGGTGQDTGMAYMQQMIDDIRGGTNSANSQNVSSVLDAIPTPNKINSQDFLRSAPSTQNMILQGMQEKYGLDPNDSMAQIKNTLPSFTAPTTFGTIKG